MPRDKFISDNLINIRDHLRQNYAAAQMQSPSDNNPAGQEIHLDLKNPVSQPAGGSSRSAEREYNEFAGKLQHDLAALGAELSHARTKLQELENFNAQLQNIAKKLQEMPVRNSQDFFREFDRFKIMYFQFSGRASAFRRTDSPAPVQPVRQEEIQVQKRDIFLPISILLAALIISLSLFLLFA